MSLFSSLFGDINTGDLAYMRDGHLASYNYGQTNNFTQLNHPRVKFMYFVRFNFNDALASYTSKYFKPFDMALLIPLIKSVDQPSVKIETAKLNQYNKKRLAQTSISQTPIKMSFYDVADGKTMRLWEMYYEYYFRNGVNEFKVDPSTLTYVKDKFENDTVKGTFRSSDSGYNIGQVKNENHLFSSIDIYQVHGGSFSKTILVNPRITEYNPGQLSFSANELCEINMTLDYEDVLYYNYIEPMRDDDLEVFANSTFHDLQPTKPKMPLNINNRAGKSLTINSDGTTSDDSFFGKLTDTLGTSGGLLISDLLNVGTNLQRNVGGLLTSLPGVLASGVKTGILTGEFEFPINLKSATDNILDQAKRQTIGSGVRSFGAAVEGATGAVTGLASGLFVDTERGSTISLEQRNTNGL